MDDDLEYHISFPLPRNCSEVAEEIPGSASHPRLYNHGNYTEDFYNKTSKSLKIEPVIFLLGWFGAQDRYLSKYSALYNELGCIAIRYTAPPQNSFLNSKKKLMLISERLIRLLEETSLSNHPVVFHNFSNHGANLYSYISKNLQASTNLSINIKGCIFDSCPAPQRALSVGRSTFRSLGGPPLLRFVFSCAVAVYQCFRSIYHQISWFITGHEFLLPPWDLINEPFRWPQLFIYSVNDDLIHYKDIELFASKRREMDIDIFEKKFEDSPHVAHLKAHPREYEGSVNDFLTHCLKKKMPSQPSQKADEE